MQGKNMSLPISFSVNNEISDGDNRFIKVVIDILHTGVNYNGSIFSKEVVNENIETIKNIPILGFIHEVPFEGKDFKGHEYIIAKTEDGIERKYIGESFGVIPESCNPRWITKMTDSGEEKEFLQVDGLLWCKFQDAVDIILKDIEKPQSMELYPDSIDGYDDEDGNFVFTKFSFEGSCILGSQVEPAMENSTITVNFTVNDFVKSVQNEIIDKYSAFTKIVNENKLVDNTGDIAFTNLENMVNENNNGGIENMSKTETDFTQTILQQFEDISAIVRQHEMITDRWGDEYPRYYTVDIQENEVIVVDRMNGYNYFGLSFTMNGDKAEIDFESAKRKKICYEDYVEGVVAPEGAFDFGSHISEIEETAFTKLEEVNDKVKEAEEKATEFEAAKNEIEENYNQVVAEFEEMKPKYEEFVQAEQARIDAEIEAQKDAEFAKYETVLVDCAEFEELKAKKSEMTVKEIEGECAIIYARKSLEQNNFSRTNANNAMVAGIIVESDEKEGYVNTKYGYIPVGNH